MKIIGNIFTNNYWLMKVAPLALALSAVVIFFCILYDHIWSVGRNLKNDEGGSDKSRKDDIIYSVAGAEK